MIILYVFIHVPIYVLYGVGTHEQHIGFTLTTDIDILRIYSFIQVCYGAGTHARHIGFHPLNLLTHFM